MTRRDDRPVVGCPTIKLVGNKDGTKEKTKDLEVGEVWGSGNERWGSGDGVTLRRVAVGRGWVGGEVVGWGAVATGWVVGWR